MIKEDNFQYRIEQHDSGKSVVMSEQSVLNQITYDLDLAFSIFIKMNFTNVRFNEGAFYQSQIVDTIFKDCVFCKVDFESVKVRDCSFINCKIENSDFREFDATGTHFKNCEFLNTNLDLSDFRDCVFTDTFFENSCLASSFIINSQIIKLDTQKFVENEGFEPVLKQLGLIS